MYLYFSRWSPLRSIYFCRHPNRLISQGLKISITSMLFAKLFSDARIQMNCVKESFEPSFDTVFGHGWTNTQSLADKMLCTSTIHTTLLFHSLSLYNLPERFCGFFQQFFILLLQGDVYCLFHCLYLTNSFYQLNI